MCVYDEGRVGWFMVYKSRPIVIISRAIVASFGDLCTGSCGSVKVQHGVANLKNTIFQGGIFSVIYWTCSCPPEVPTLLLHYYVCPALFRQ